LLLFLLAKKHWLKKRTTKKEKMSFHIPPTFTAGQVSASSIVGQPQPIAGPRVVGAQPAIYVQPIGYGYGYPYGGGFGFPRYVPNDNAEPIPLPATPSSYNPKIYHSARYNIKPDSDLKAVEKLLVKACGVMQSQPGTISHDFAISNDGKWVIQNTTYVDWNAFVANLNIWAKGYAQTIFADFMVKYSDLNQMSVTVTGPGARNDEPRVAAGMQDYLKAANVSIGSSGGFFRQ